VTDSKPVDPKLVVSNSLSISFARPAWTGATRSEPLMMLVMELSVKLPALAVICARVAVSVFDAKIQLATDPTASSTDNAMTAIRAVRKALFVPAMRFDPPGPSPNER
jgi:hypothetical protein